MDDDKQDNQVSSVSKMFKILEALSDQKATGVSELAIKTQMSKATTYRFLQTMKTLGCVEQDDDVDKYSLTLNLLDMGSKAIEHPDLLSAADKEMRQLGKLTGEAVHLGVRHNNKIIYLHKIESDYSLGMRSRIGKGNPLYSTAIGKVLLSEWTQSSVREVLSGVKFEKYTDNTISKITDLYAVLKQTREQGVAEDIEEQEMGVRCIAVPVRCPAGEIIAGLSLSFPVIRFQQQKRHDYIKDLSNTSARITQTLAQSLSVR